MIFKMRQMNRIAVEVALPVVPSGPRTSRGGDAMRRAFLILIDGLRPDVLEAEVAAGRLPNLTALTDRGARSRAISVLPTTTSVAYLPFLTGCFPGTCNIPSIRWLDREAYTGRWWKDRAAVRNYCGYQAGMLDDDIAPGVQTIFQLVPESLGIFTMITRGLTPERDPAQGARKVVGSLAHYVDCYGLLDRRAARELLAAVDQPWRFVFTQFPGGGRLHPRRDAGRTGRCCSRCTSSTARSDGPWRGWMSWAHSTTRSSCW